MDIDIGGRREETDVLTALNGDGSYSYKTSRRKPTLFRDKVE
jgi:hypothetical protein